MAPQPLWPFVLYVAATVVLIAVMIGLSAVLGQRHRAKAMVEPFESGIVGVGTARYRFPVRFYLVAMFFVIFDVEAVFISAWAIAWRQVGWTGYVEVLVFIVVLLVALAYLWRLGGLDWEPRRSLRRAADGE